MRAQERKRKEQFSRETRRRRGRVGQDRWKLDWSDLVPFCSSFLFLCLFLSLSLAVYTLSRSGDDKSKAAGKDISSGGDRSQIRDRAAAAAARSSFLTVFLSSPHRIPRATIYVFGRAKRRARARARHSRRARSHFIRS